MKRSKSIIEILEDAVMIIIGSAFAIHMAKVLLAKYNLTLYDLWQTFLRMPSDLWNSGDSLFCALGLLVTGLGLAMAGWAFLQVFFESCGLTMQLLLKKINNPLKVNKTV